MRKTLQELFVDRTRHSHAFCKMLDGQTLRRIMVLTAASGMGKSWLLHTFAHEARRRKLPLVRIDFADRQPYDTLMLARRCRDALGPEHFNPLTEAINHATTAHVTLATDTATSLPNLAPPPAQLSVDTGGGDYAQGEIDKRQGTFIEGPIIKDNFFVIGSNDPIMRQAVEDRITSAFFECLARICGQTRVVFLFDTYERNTLKSENWMPRAADRWICGELLSRIRDGKLQNVIVVIAGRRAPEFGAAWNEVLGHMKLDLLEYSDMKEYLRERRGLAAITDAEVERLCQAVAGSPQVLGMIGDNLEQANKPASKDDDW
jgi:hypothetical protein